MPLIAYLLVAAALFCIGLYTVLSRRNAVAILMGVELMLNAVNINLVAFWRFQASARDVTTVANSGLKTLMAGQAFAVFAFVVAAAEVAVGLALILSMYRNRRTVAADDVDSLRF